MAGALRTNHTNTLAIVAVCIALLTFVIFGRSAKNGASDMAPDEFLPPFVRTDFSNDAAWQQIRAEVCELSPDLRSYINLMKS